MEVIRENEVVQSVGMNTQDALVQFDRLCNFHLVLFVVLKKCIVVITYLGLQL